MQRRYLLEGTYFIQVLEKWIYFQKCSFIMILNNVRKDLYFLTYYNVLIGTVYN